MRLTFIPVLAPVGRLCGGVCVPGDVVSAELLQPLELLVHGLGVEEDGLEAGQQPGHGGGAGEAVML